MVAAAISTVTPLSGLKLTEAFMEARFLDEGRHLRRLNKVLAVEDDYMSRPTER